MSKTGKLFSTKKPYDWEGSEMLFREAIAENFRFHDAHCAQYHDLIVRENFDPAQLETEGISALPVLPTLYFKRNRLLSLPERRLLIKVTSSGTGGKKSLVGFDLVTLWRELKMVVRIASYHRLWSARLTRYVIFGYRPRRGQSLGAAKSAYGFTFFAPAMSRVYALEWQDGAYRLDLDRIKEALVRYAKGRHPVRTMGFPAYTYFLLKAMKEEGLKVKLPKGSLVCLGGGWKQFYAEKVEKEEFYRLTEEVLGVDSDHVVEFFGAVEHPILYTDCRAHHFHVPAYGRVVIRDVDTLEPVGYGRAGLVNLLTPAIRSMPLTSVLTDDIGILHSEPCPCGCKAPWLEILGRVGVKDIVTCAQGAEEILKGEPT